MTPKSPVEVRAEAYAHFGLSLISSLTTHHIPLDLYTKLSFTDQLIHVSQIPQKHPHYDAAVRAAITLLLTSFPVQAPMSSIDIIGLARLAFPVGTYSRSPHSPPTNLPLRAILKTPFLMQYFPFKYHPAATMKTNVRMSDLLRSLASQGILARFETMIYALAGRVSDDQACSAILYASGLAPHLGPYAYEFASCCVLSPKNAKGLSTALKALGANSHPTGALLIEADTLQGRGVGSVDLLQEAKYRCDPSLVAASVIDLDPELLRLAIDDILDEELKVDKVEIPTPQEFWQRRWLWCVNGSHSRVLDRRGGLDTRSIFPGVDRVYRRMYAEAQSEEPLTSWDAQVSVSASEKLEHGKTRAIFACDTLSYFAFEHLLSPVEKAWRGVRVVLDPGTMGHLGVANRIARIQIGGVHVMLDYDDFNSQHSTSSMKVLFQALTERIGYPPDLAGNILSSFDNMWLYCKGTLVGRAEGTLMSGHRATTFINSVLNAAYIRLSLGKEVYERYKAVHVGDDIYMNAPTHSDAALVLTRAQALGCRMNPAKQSVGTVGAEFLRMGIRPGGAVGYFARSVASAVSGNWVTEARQSPIDALKTAIANVRTLCNRSRSEAFPTLLAGPLSRLTRVPRRLVHALLDGSKAIEGAPIFHSDGMIRTITEVPPPPEQMAERLPPDWPRHATNDYVVNCATAVEQFALKEAGRSVASAMLIASYNKALTSVAAPPAYPRFKANRPRAPVGSQPALALLYTRKTSGVLQGYPLLTLLKAHISRTLLRTLVILAGGDPNVSDLDAEAWGPDNRSTIVQGSLSYADAAALSNKATTGVLYTTYNVYM